MVSSVFSLEMNVMATERFRGDFVLNICQTVHQYVDETKFVLELCRIQSYLKGAVSQCEQHQIIWWNGYSVCESYFDSFVELVEKFTMKKVIKHLVFKDVTESQFESLVDKLVSAYEEWKCDNDAMNSHFADLDNLSETGTWTSELEPNWKICEILSSCHKISAKPILERTFGKVEDTE